MTLTEAPKKPITYSLGVIGNRGDIHMKHFYKKENEYASHAQEFGNLANVNGSQRWRMENGNVTWYDEPKRSDYFAVDDAYDKAGVRIKGHYVWHLKLDPTYLKESAMTKDQLMQDYHKHNDSEQAKAGFQVKTGGWLVRLPGESDRQYERRSKESERIANDLWRNHYKQRYESLQESRLKTFGHFITERLESNLESRLRQAGVDPSKVTQQELVFKIALSKRLKDDWVDLVTTDGHHPCISMADALEWRKSYLKDFGQVVKFVRNKWDR